MSRDNTKRKGGRTPKFDYDSDEFYDEILALAMQGFTDSEIAYGLDDKFGASLDPDVFGSMKNGHYANWSEEENQRRSERINRVLARGRMKVNSIVRGRYLKAALGGIKTKSVSVIERSIRDEYGNETGKTVLQTTSGEIELPPNIQALSTWLYHHDPEWREAQQAEKKSEESTGNGNMPDDIHIEVVYNEKEHLELQGKRMIEDGKNP